MGDLEVPTEKQHRHRHRRSNHHRRHQHARHLRSRGVNAQDNLELRIKTGIQKLEEERKAYQGVLAEIDEGVGAKEYEDINSKSHFTNGEVYVQFSTYI